MKGMLQRLTLLAATMVAAAALLAGCSGSDGANGANGLNGIDGKDGKGVAGRTIETCVVCHGATSNAVDNAHGVVRYQDLAVTGITGAVVGADLQVTFNVKVNGSNKVNYYNEVFNIYRFDGTKRYQAAVNAGTGLVTGATIAPTTVAGNYTVTIPGAAANVANNRYAVYIRSKDDNTLPASVLKPNGYRAIVLLDFPASPVTDLLGSTSTSCENCHGSYGNGFHNGYPANGGKTCVVCHDATKNVSALNVETDNVYPWAARMIHTIHKSGTMPTGTGTVYTKNYNAATTPVTGSKWDYKIAFPTYMDNCSICHQSGAPLTTVNSKAVSYDFCMTCHQNWDGFAETITGGSLSFHRSYTSTVGNCATCHDGSTAPATMGAAHNKAELSTERGGLLYNGVDLSVTEGANTVVTINSVAKSADNKSLVIKWGAKYKGVDTDPCFAGPATSGKPAFAGFRTLVDHGTTTTLMHNFSFLKGFFVGDDVVNGANGATSPGQPISVNVVFPNQPASTTGGVVPTPNTACTATEATTTLALTTAEQALAATAAKMRVGLQGKPVLKHDTTSKYYYLRAQSPVYDLDLKTNAKAATFRRGSTNQYNSVTETAKCLKCHVGSLYQHGGNRVDNIELCVMCHNEASNEQNVRVGMGITDKTKTYDGKLGQTYGFKSLLHAVHSSGHATLGTDPIAVYRSNGIYTFALEEKYLYNWPGKNTTAIQVFAATVPTLRAHNFATAHYPRPLQDCLACHASNFSRIPDPTKAVATTLEAGAAPWDNQLDDKLQGATAAACTSCHSGSATADHAATFGFAPAVFEKGRQTLIEAK